MQIMSPAAQVIGFRVRARVQAAVAGHTIQRGPREARFGFLRLFFNVGSNN